MRKERSKPLRSSGELVGSFVLEGNQDASKVDKAVADLDAVVSVVVLLDSQAAEGRWEEML
jgi:hypothetical protein